MQTLDDTPEIAIGLGQRQLELIGPIPIYVLNPEDAVSREDVIDPRALRRTGWRALINSNNEPFALSEISFAPDGAELFGIRGREAASAFHSILRRSLAFQEEADVYEVRWLTIPDIYVSSLWLAGPRSAFIPSRLGESERAEQAVLTWPQLRERVTSLVEAARPQAALIERDPGSPRSGLPR
ncbi:hypothetical protein [Sphingomonas sp. 22176]|uniref:hypothetical protein n=1 Tax=Sphingomonas sp. 22176 TaxID=3453884 RepID=UPI003F87E220